MEWKREADRQRETEKKPSTQPAFDPQGWMDGGKEGKRMQEVGT